MGPCRSRKCTFPPFHLSMKLTDWHRSCSDNRSASFCFVYFFLSVCVQSVKQFKNSCSFTLMCCLVLLQELWLEYIDQERLQYDERETLSLWEKVQSEPTFLQPQSSGFTDYTSQSTGAAHTFITLYLYPEEVQC